LPQKTNKVKNNESKIEEGYLTKELNSITSSIEGKRSREKALEKK